MSFSNGMTSDPWNSLSENLKQTYREEFIVESIFFTKNQGSQAR